MDRNVALKEALNSIFGGIKDLRTAFEHRKFTIDGRLVGDIGEVIAGTHYQLQLDAVSRHRHDAVATDGTERQVQIKATFQDALTFSSVPQHYLGLQLKEDGSFDEIFNGPGRVIAEHYRRRKGIGAKLLRFPVSALRALQASVDDKDRVPRREQA